MFQVGAAIFFVVVKPVQVMAARGKEPIEEGMPDEERRTRSCSPRCGRRASRHASVRPMGGLLDELDAIAAETTFSGVVRVDRAGEVELARAYGLAHRGYEIPNALDTQFAIASGSEGPDGARRGEPDRGRLARALDTTARSVLGDDLPLIDDDVTIEHLLAHRSGIGDYLDEDVEQDSPTTCCRCRCTSSRRPSSTSPCSTGTRQVRSR